MEWTPRVLCRIILVQVAVPAFGSLSVTRRSFDSIEGIEYLGIFDWELTVVWFTIATLLGGFERRSQLLDGNLSVESFSPIARCLEKLNRRNLRQERAPAYRPDDLQDFRYVIAGQVPLPQYRVELFVLVLTPKV